MNRISDLFLQAKVDTINTLQGFDTANVSWNTVGGIRLAGAYGGTGVEQVCNEHGGVSDLFGGYGTKREVAHFLTGMIAGMRLDQPV